MLMIMILADDMADHRHDVHIYHHNHTAVSSYDIMISWLSDVQSYKGYYILQLLLVATACVSYYYYVQYVIPYAHVCTSYIVLHSTVRPRTAYA